MVAPNITPDRDTGIGAWSADDFWHALHNGKSRDGRLLYPAFPYTNYTRVTRADSDALYAFMRTRAGAEARQRTARSCASRTTSKLALAGWRLLYFKPAVFEAGADAKRRMEPRRLPGRGPGPLRGLPQQPQHAGRAERRAWPAA